MYFPLDVPFPSVYCSLERMRRVHERGLDLIEWGQKGGVLLHGIVVGVLIPVGSFLLPIGSVKSVLLLTAALFCCMRDK